MDRRVTAFLLRYLLEHRFESKADMARQLDIQPRTLEKVFENLDRAKAGSVAFDKAIYYCAKNHISLDNILGNFMSHFDDVHPDVASGMEAFRRLSLSEIEGLSKEGREIYASMLDFLQTASTYICPSCKTWCDPWNGNVYVEQLNCCIGHMAQEIIRDISELYTK